MKCTVARDNFAIISKVRQSRNNVVERLREFDKILTMKATIITSISWPWTV
jgi:hypothetical protein